MSGATPRHADADEYPTRCGAIVPVQNGSSLSSTVPAGVVELLDLDGDSRLWWTFDPAPEDDGVDPYTGEAAVNRNGQSTLEATIPTFIVGGMGIEAGGWVNWWCVGGEPAEVLHVGSGLPPAEVRVVDG